MEITCQCWGELNDGRPVRQFTCVNDGQMTLEVLDYGAHITQLRVPDRLGRTANVTLGFPHLAGYVHNDPYFGSTVGRYANRIAGGRFSGERGSYQLATNNGPNHLHGGPNGFHRQLWHAEPIRQTDSVGVQFRYTSPDGEEGYPGTMNVTVTYRITADQCLLMEYEATTDQPTIVNLTNHCYWNLSGVPEREASAASVSGHAATDILDHRLQLESDYYLSVDATLIPTGKAVAVDRTPFDFTVARPIGARLNDVPGDPPGYDHCFVLRTADGDLHRAAWVKDPATGRTMEVLTTQPGIQFYTGNFLEGVARHAGFRQHQALCLETQHFPDSPNQIDFPTVWLLPGHTYRQTTVHRFGADAACP